MNAHRPGLVGAEADRVKCQSSGSKIGQSKDCSRHGGLSGKAASRQRSAGHTPPGRRNPLGRLAPCSPQQPTAPAAMQAVSAGSAARASAASTPR